MLPTALLGELIDGAGVYFAFLLVFVAVYALLLRRYVYSLFDPLLINLIFSTFAGALVLFMYVRGLMDPRYLYSYVATQLAFIFGLRCFKPVTHSHHSSSSAVLSADSDDAESVLHFLYLLASTTFVVATLVSYGVGGIPLFYESRLDFYKSETGFGIVGRLMHGSGIITTYLVLDRFSRWSSAHLTDRIYDVLILAAIVVAGILSGSKSSFISLLFILFFYQFFTARFRPKSLLGGARVYEYSLLALAICAALFVAVLQQAGDETAGLALLNRFLFSGDVFVLAYPNDVILHMTAHNPFLVIFQDFIGLMRVVPWAELPTTLGIELFQYHVPTLDSVGPNPRHNVFGVVYFGFIGAVVYSFALGWFVSFVRNRMYWMFPSTVTGGLLYTLIALPVSGIEVDVALVVGYLDSTFLAFVPLYLFSLLLVRAARPAPFAGEPNASIGAR